jgi:hypothetical protein
MDDFKDLLARNSSINCTFEKDLEEIKDEKFYFCSCSFKKLSLICKNCMETCHRAHTKILQVEDHFVQTRELQNCECGKNCHKHFIEDKTKKNCFISEIMLNLGLDEFQDIDKKTYCFVCKNNPDCRGNNFGKRRQTVFKEKISKVCECSIHIYANLSIFYYYITSKNFKELLPNLSLNILYKSDTAKEKIFDRFKFIIDETFSKTETDNNKATDLKENFNKFYQYKEISKILKIFIFFLKRKSEKKYLDQTIITQSPNLNYPDFMELLKYQVFKNFESDNFENFKKYIKIKNNLYYFLFSFYIKTYIDCNNNTYKIKNILLMNLIQRRICLFNSLSFSEYREKKNEKMNFLNRQQIKEFCDLIFVIWEQDIGKNLTEIFFNDKKSELFILDLLIKRAKMIKFLIKFNLISSKQKNKFFQEFQKYVFDLDIAKNTNHIHVNELVNQMIKSVFYYMLYCNDSEYLEKAELEFSFFNELKEAKQMMSNVFGLCLKLYKREKAQLTDSLKFDFIIKKFLDLQLGNNNIYKDNLRNLKLIHYSSLDTNIRKYEISSILEQNELFKILCTFSDNIEDLLLKIHRFEKNDKSNNYDYNNFLEEVEKSIQELKESLENENITFFNYVDHSIDDLISGFNNIPGTKVNSLHYSLKFTKFCQNISELINMIVKYRNYNKFLIKEDVSSPEEEIPNRILSSEKSKYLLNLLMLLIYKCPENVVYIASIRPFSFSNFFFTYCPGEFQNFLIFFSDFLFNNDKKKECYKFDNYYFFSKMCLILLNRKFDDNTVILIKF